MKIILVGSSGAMGQTILNLVEGSDRHQVVAGVQEEASTEGAIPFFASFDDLYDAEISADVIIDFSHVSLTDAMIDFAVKSKLPVMLATTGQNEDQEANIEAASQSIAILNAHNTSIGVNVMEHIVGEMTKILYPLGYDIEIIEKHHRHKKDAPSGTAVMLKDSIVENMSEEADINHGRSGLGEPRRHEEIGIHAIRGGDIVGEHTVLFANNQEVLELKHSAGSKDIFARGAITGAEFLVDAKPGLYSMTDALSELS